MGIMHRDVKPHNVMIDHENRKVRSSDVFSGGHCVLLFISCMLNGLLNSVFSFEADH